MIRSLPSSRRYRWSFNLFIALYFVLLFAPLVVTMILAFNDSMYPSLPWEGFTLDWFFGSGPEVRHFQRPGEPAEPRLFVPGRPGGYVHLHHPRDVRSLSLRAGEFPVQGGAVFPHDSAAGHSGRHPRHFHLMFANTVGIFIEDLTGIYVKSLVPGFWLVVLGQSSFISTIVALVVSARLKKFDRSLEEAAYNLGRTGRKCSGTSRCRSFVRPFWGGGGGVSHVFRELQHDHFHRRIPGDPAHQHVHAGP